MELSPECKLYVRHSARKYVDIGYTVDDYNKIERDLSVCKHTLSSILNMNSLEDIQIFIKENLNKLEQID